MKTYTTIQSLEQGLLKKGIKYCVNTAVISEDEVKFIIVGDNPGINEFKDKKYFIGSAGKQLRKIFVDKGLVKNFDMECKVFNKTIIHTAFTNGLFAIQKSSPIEFEDSLKLSAREIAKFANDNKLPILVFGKSNLSKLFHVFMKELLSNVKDSEKIMVFSHPSRGHFNKEWKNNSKLNSEVSNEEILTRIGKQNFNSIKSKFI